MTATEPGAHIHTNRWGRTRHVLRLAMPSAAEAMLGMLVGLVNIYLVGHLGATSIAAVGLGWHVALSVMILFTGVGTGATALIAREKSDELIAKGYAEDFITRCSNYLENPGISVVRDAQIAAQAARLHAMHDPTEGGVATGLFELATASDVGLEIDAEALFISEESARLCSEFALDPLGVISSGALLIGCAAQDANAVIAALERQNIRAQKIASAKTSDFGLVLNRGGQTATLPQFAADEIIRLFED